MEQQASQSEGSSRTDQLHSGSGQLSMATVIEPGSVYIAPAGQHATELRKSNSRAVVCLSDLPAGTLTSLRWMSPCFHRSDAMQWASF